MILLLRHQQHQYQYQYQHQSQITNRNRNRNHNHDRHFLLVTMVFIMATVLLLSMSTSSLSLSLSLTTITKNNHCPYCDRKQEQKQKQKHYLDHAHAATSNSIIAAFDGRNSMNHQIQTQLNNHNNDVEIDVNVDVDVDDNKPVIKASDSATTPISTTTTTTTMNARAELLNRHLRMILTSMPVSNTVTDNDISSNNNSNIGTDIMEAAIRSMTNTNTKKNDNDNDNGKDERNNNNNINNNNKNQHNRYDPRYGRSALRAYRSFVYSEKYNNTVTDAILLEGYARRIAKQIKNMIKQHTYSTQQGLSSPPKNNPTTSTTTTTATPQHFRDKIANSIAKGERRARERSHRKLRDVCAGCHRPFNLCLCDVLGWKKNQNQNQNPLLRLSNRQREIQIVVLQHPNEFRKKHISTVPLLTLVLGNDNVHIQVGYDFTMKDLHRISSKSKSTTRTRTRTRTATTTNSHNNQKNQNQNQNQNQNTIHDNNDDDDNDDEDDHHQYLMLFPGPDAIDLDVFVATQQQQQQQVEQEQNQFNSCSSSSSSSSNSNSSSTNDDDDDDDDDDDMMQQQLVGKKTKKKKKITNTLVLIDGTWSEAKRMIRSSPSVLEGCQMVQFSFYDDDNNDHLRKDDDDDDDDNNNDTDEGDNDNNNDNDNDNDNNNKLTTSIISSLSSSWPTKNEVSTSDSIRSSNSKNNHRSRSIYNAMRKEPNEYCLSTLEACGEALTILLDEQLDDEQDEDTHPLLLPTTSSTRTRPTSASSSSSDIQRRLTTVLQKHVELHLRNARESSDSDSRHNKDTTSRDKKIQRVKEIEQSIYGKSRTSTPSQSHSDDDNEKDTTTTTVMMDNKITIQIRPLTHDDMPLIDSWWENGHTSKSTNIITRAIDKDRQKNYQTPTLRTCLGIIIDDDDNDDDDNNNNNHKLIACIVRYETGTLGILHVVEDYRNKGYGAALLKEVTRRIMIQQQQQGDDSDSDSDSEYDYNVKGCEAYIRDGNVASESVFTKVGWKCENDLNGIIATKGTGRRRSKKKWIYK